MRTQSRCEPTASFRNAKGWSKASVVSTDKTAIGLIFKQLLGQTSLRPTKRKMQILPSRFDIQVNTHGVSLQFPRNLQTDLGSLDLCYREKVMEQTFGCCFAFPCECGDLPSVLVSGEITSEK